MFIGFGCRLSFKRVYSAPLTSTDILFSRLGVLFPIEFKDNLTVLYGIFVELGGGVDDVPGWRRDGAYVELGFR